MTSTLSRRDAERGPGRVVQGGGLLLLLATAVVLGFIAATVVGHSLALGFAACALPLVPIMLLRPEIPAVAALAVLPFETNLAPVSVGVNVAASDLLFAICFVGLIYRYSTDLEARARLRHLRPLLSIVAIYVAAAILVTAAHPGKTTLVNLVQRVEVVGIPLLVGATLLSARAANLALRLFMVAAVVVATAALLTPGVAGSYLGIQKNPAGQYIADAAFLSIVCIPKPVMRYLVFGYLVVGVYSTHSRGALLGVLVGVAVYLAVTSSNLVQAGTRIVSAAVLAFAVFSFLPHTAQERLLGQAKTTQFNDLVRREYAEDATRIIGDHPVLGVGIGNYFAGEATNGSLSTDPHNIVLLETAEGGYVLITAFGLLQLGALVIVLRRRKAGWALAALAVQIAILTHAQVDIYWVRGTPVMGWLLIGLTLSSGQALEAPSAGRGSGERRLAIAR